MGKSTKPNNPFQHDVVEFLQTIGHWLKINFTAQTFEVLAALTAVIISYYALKSADKSVKLTRESLDLTKQSNEENDSLNKELFVQYAKQAAASDSSAKATANLAKTYNEQLAVSKKAIQIQLSNLEEQRKQFETLNTPYVQLEPNLNNAPKENGWPTTIDYQIKNLGKFPVKIVSGYISLYVSASSNVRFEDAHLEQNHECLKKMQIYVTDKTGYYSIRDVLYLQTKDKDGHLYQCPTPYTSRNIADFVKRKSFLYIAASLRYESLLDASKYKYEVLIKIDRTEFEYSYNRNFKVN